MKLKEQDDLQHTIYVGWQVSWYLSFPFQINVDVDKTYNFLLSILILQLSESWHFYFWMCIWNSNLEQAIKYLCHNILCNYASKSYNYALKSYIQEKITSSN